MRTACVATREQNREGKKNCFRKILRDGHRVVHLLAGTGRAAENDATAFKTEQKFIISYRKPITPGSAVVVP